MVLCSCRIEREVTGKTKTEERTFAFETLDAERSTHAEPVAVASWSSAKNPCPPTCYKGTGTIGGGFVHWRAFESEGNMFRITRTITGERQ